MDKKKHRIGYDLKIKLLRKQLKRTGYSDEGIDLYIRHVIYADAINNAQKALGRGGDYMKIPVHMDLRRSCRNHLNATYENMNDHDRKLWDATHGRSYD